MVGQRSRLTELLPSINHGVCPGDLQAAEDFMGNFYGPGLEVAYIIPPHPIGPNPVTCPYPTTKEPGKLVYPGA